MATEIGLTEIYLRETFPSSPMIGCSWDIPNVWRCSRRGRRVEIIGATGRVVARSEAYKVGRCPEGRVLLAVSGSPSPFRVSAEGDAR